MENNSEYFEDLKIIKKVMEESSRFLSLSGLSGVIAGITALAGALFAVFAFLNGSFLLDRVSISTENLKLRFIATAIVMLLVALGFAVYFSYRKSVSKKLKMWTPVSRRLLVNLFVPLFAGGFMALIFYFRMQWEYVIPCMLIFYGLGLVSAGKFTFEEIFYLGLLEILTGLLAALFPVYGILFWCFGFGLLHIIYGLAMYRKYER